MTDDIYRKDDLPVSEKMEFMIRFCVVLLIVVCNTYQFINLMFWVALFMRGDGDPSVCVMKDRYHVDFCMQNIFPWVIGHSLLFLISLVASHVMLKEAEEDEEGEKQLNEKLLEV